MSGSRRLGLLLLLAGCGAPATSSGEPPSADCLSHALWVRPSHLDDVASSAVVDSEDPSLEFDIELFRTATSRARHAPVIQAWWELQAKFWKHYTVACEDGQRLDLRISSHMGNFTVVGESGRWVLDEHELYAWTVEVDRLESLRDGIDLAWWEREREFDASMRSLLESGLQQLVRGDPEPVIELLADDFMMTWSGEAMDRDAAVAWLRREAVAHESLTDEPSLVITGLNQLFDEYLSIDFVLDRPRADSHGSEVLCRFKTDWHLRDGRYVIVSASS